MLKTKIQYITINKYNRYNIYKTNHSFHDNETYCLLINHIKIHNSMSRILDNSYKLLRDCAANNF